MERIAQTAIGNLDAAHFRILRAAEDAYRTVQAEAAALYATGTMDLRTAVQTALDRYADRGITGFVDSAGRHWGIREYSEMQMRTATAQARVQGRLDRFRKRGRNLVIVSDSPQECPLCRPWEGEVLAIDADGQHPTVAEATAAGLFHPNCTHSLGLYVPGLTRPMRGTENPEGYEDRQRARALERRERKWRRRKAVARTPDAKRHARAYLAKAEEDLDAHLLATGLIEQRWRRKLMRGRRGGGGGGVAATPKPRGPLFRNPKPVVNHDRMTPGIGSRVDEVIDRLHGKYGANVTYIGASNAQESVDRVIAWLDDHIGTVSSGFASRGDMPAEWRAIVSDWERTRDRILATGDVHGARSTTFGEFFPGDNPFIIINADQISRLDGPDMLDALERVVTHEYGHVLHRSIRKEADRFYAPSNVSMTFESSIPPTTRYSTENVAERVAEAFALHETNLPGSEDFRLDIFDLIFDVFALPDPGRPKASHEAAAILRSSSQTVPAGWTDTFGYAAVTRREVIR